MVYSNEVLSGGRGLPRERGLRLSAAEATAQLAELPDWRLTHGGACLRRDWTFPDFRTAVTFAKDVAALAEREQHHPDLRIEGYRVLWIELTTHAIGGLSINDFILAAKIDRIAPV